VAGERFFSVYADCKPLSLSWKVRILRGRKSWLPGNAFQDRLLPSERPPLGPAVDLPTHCTIIQTCCNAIRTLLQVNSNNSTGCALLNYFAVAGFRGISRDLAGYRGVYLTKIPSKLDLLMRN
jgi:hypothetical protein